jgi:hypothetical protein
MIAYMNRNTRKKKSYHEPAKRQNQNVAQKRAASKNFQDTWKAEKCKHLIIENKKMYAECIFYAGSRIGKGGFIDDELSALTLDRVGT